MLFLWFLAVFELLSDNLAAIYVEPHQCPSHQLILLTQGPICEICGLLALQLARLVLLSFECDFFVQFISLVEIKHQIISHKDCFGNEPYIIDVVKKSVLQTII